MNFGAGPGTLPLAALERAQGDLLDFDGTGMGICEHSHRGKAYSALHAETKALLTGLLGLDESWEAPRRSSRRFR
jgi:phosphoserine aminotransferase